MKFSIITPAFNSAATIADTLASVHGQSQAGVEHIIIDGCSQDGTSGLVRASAPHAICISETDEGLYDAMNKGIRLAKGDIIGILNSDDFYPHANVLQAVAAVFEDKGCDAVYGDIVYVDAHDTGKVVRTWIAGSYRREKFLYGWMPPHPAFFVRRHVYERYGLFDTAFRTAADYELMLRLLYRHRITVCYLPQRLVCMRTGGVSNASFRHRMYANREDRRAWQINGLTPRFYTTWLKPIRKIHQFLP